MGVSLRIGGVVVMEVEAVFKAREEKRLVFREDEVGRKGLGLESLSLASTSLASPSAWVIVVGLSMASSFLISGSNPDMKQLRSASGVKP